MHAKMQPQPLGLIKVSRNHLRLRLLTSLENYSAIQITSNANPEDVATVANSISTAGG
jgi:hypothetical protein